MFFFSSGGANEYKPSEDSFDDSDSTSMGVRGLTTFIKRQEKKFMKDHKLHNCKVLLDGNSVASKLYIWSNIESAFGGDYDKFAKYVKEFFKVLQKCEIIPLVVFDGGYEGRKLKTVYSRMREKYKSTRHAQPLTGPLNFPLFMRIVFREVLIELNIVFAQSDFEADDELAALARQMQCPVLSYDSDFYIYDVLYIPLPTLGLQPIAFKNTSFNECSESKYFLDCKIYRVDVLLESFGGLDKSMLPLLATLLGNDYIKRSVFKAFYANLKIPKGKTHALYRRIKAVVDWLRNETFESAVRKILGRMKKNSRIRIMRQMRKIVNGYVQCTSVLSEYLMTSVDADLTDENVKKRELSKMDSDVLNIIEKIDVNIDTIEDKMESFDCEEGAFEEESSSETGSEILEDGLISDTLNIKDPVKNTLSEDATVEAESEIPEWLLKFARKGRIQSCVIDILSLKQYFFPPQVEDHSLPASHFISLKILSATVGLLLGNCDTLVKYWTRNGSSLDWYTVEPVYETASVKFPPCVEIMELSESVRKAILLEAAENTIDLTTLPEEWHLFIVAVIFWLKHMEEPLATEGHLHTMVMCLVAMFAIDSKIGVHRNKQTFTRKYKKVLNKVIDYQSKQKALKESNKMVVNLQKGKDQVVDPKTDLANVSREDCLLMFEKILPYHHLSEQVKIKPKQFCLETVHAFAQFQSCLFHLIVLNSVLGFPLKETLVSHLYSGTFVYNIFMNLSKRNNISAYLETLFQTSPSLLKLYKSLMHLLENALTEVNLYKRPIKTHKKKKKQNQKLVETADTCNRDYDEEDINFVDENNMFSGLTLNE